MALGATAAGPDAPVHHHTAVRTAADRDDRPSMVVVCATIRQHDRLLFKVIFESQRGSGTRTRLRLALTLAHLGPEALPRLDRAPVVAPPLQHAAETCQRTTQPTPQARPPFRRRCSTPSSEPEVEQAQEPRSERPPGEPEQSAAARSARKSGLSRRPEGAGKLRWEKTGGAMGPLRSASEDDWIRR